MKKLKPVTVTLAYNSNAQALGGSEATPYQIVKIHNEIAVPVCRKGIAKPARLPITEQVNRHVGDFLTEWEAGDLLTNPDTEVITVPAKDR